VYLYINGERTRINTKVDVQGDQWDEKKGVINEKQLSIEDAFHKVANEFATIKLI